MLDLTKKDMPGWLLRQPRSSVISAGFKYSRETRTSEMIEGRALGCLTTTVLFMHRDGSKLLSRDCIFIHRTFTHFFKRLGKKQIQWEMWLNHRYISITVEKFSFKTGLLTLSSLSHLICPEVWLVDNFTHFIKWLELVETTLASWCRNTPR